MSVLSLASGPMLAALCFSLPPSAQGATQAFLPLRGSPTVFNLRRQQTGEEIKLGNGFAMFLVPEAFRVDYNGDGDSFDLTLQAVDFTDAKLVDMGVAIVSGTDSQRFKVQRDHAAFIADERDTGPLGTDFNGDGDTGDDVAFVYDAPARRIASLQFASAASQFQLGDDLAAFSAVESEQALTDLNGDRDTNDRVLFVHDFRTRQTTNVGLAVGLFTLFGYEPLNLAVGRSDVLFGAYEINQGEDLNHDGDRNDIVLHVYSAAARATKNLELYFLEARYADGLFALAISEQGSGAKDLNGDGDALDDVLFVFDPVSSALENLGFAMRERFGSHDMQVADGLIAFLASESHAGADFNLDGDTFDRVLHVYDHRAGTITNTRIATSSSSDPVQFAVVRPFVVFQSRELSQAEDLNGDGDLNDKVAFLYDCRDGSVENLGVATPSSNESVFALTTEVLGFLVGEESEGTDLNGDTTFDDEVLFVCNLKSGEVTNTGASVWSGTFGDAVGLRAEGSRLVYETQEAELDRDVTFDGDLADTVLRLFDLAADRTIAVDLASRDFGSRAFQFDGRWLVFPVEESQQGDTDLNGDGDAEDSVVHLTRLESSSSDALPPKSPRSESAKLSGRDGRSTPGCR